ncbi:Demethylmenaquinone methyltransferase [archaeon HR01]|nr:Demethylmenaquinone methyltransferase [archaeon HR01]
MDGSRLREYWDWVAENSFHIRQSRPTVSDIYYRHIVVSLIEELTSGLWWRILKLDAYNEATSTQYGFHLLREGRDLVLVDISAGIAGRAAERAMEKNVYGSVHMIVGDFRRLPLRRDCFDMTCSFGSIEHVADYQRAFYEQIRVVRPGGEILVGVPNIANYSMRMLFTKILHILGPMRKVTNPERHFLPSQLLSMAKRLGLNSLVLSGYHLFPKQLRWLDLWLDSRGRNSMGKSRFFRWLLKTFTILEKCHPFTRNFAEMIIVKGVKRGGQGRELRSLEGEVESIEMLHSAT